MTRHSVNDNTRMSLVISLFKFKSFDQFNTPQTASNFSHLLSCGTIDINNLLFQETISPCLCEFEDNHQLIQCWGIELEKWKIESTRPWSVRFSRSFGMKIYSVSENPRFLGWRFCNDIWRKKVAFENFCTVYMDKRTLRSRIWRARTFETS